MKIEEVDINLIKPYFRNPRNNEQTIKYLKESIKKFGFNVPIVVDKNYVIITGHARYKALQQLGYKKVPVIVKDLSEREAREYRIADNKIQERTTWDSEFLRKELMDLGEVIGFEEDEIKEIVKLVQKEDERMSKITQEVIDKTKEELDKKFEKKVKDYEEKMVTIICPHCLKEFQVRKEDIKELM